MTMYVLMNRTRDLIAAHESLDVVNEYLSYQPDPSGYKILKLKKMKKRELSEDASFHDIYLTRYVGQYIPAKFNVIMEEYEGNMNYSMRSTLNILYDMMTSCEDSKLKKSYKRVIDDISKRLLSEEPIPHDVLEQELQLYDDRMSALEGW